MNNFEKIKQMTVDEMAEKISLLKSCTDIRCKNCPIKTLCSLPPSQIDIKRYLLQEVEE